MELIKFVQIMIEVTAEYRNRTDGAEVTFSDLVRILEDVQDELRKQS